MKHNLLVVDDERNMRLVLSAMLKKEGFDVDTAEDGQQALERLAAKPYELVITDLKMPKLDGMELLARTIKDYPAIPVIIITAHGTIAMAVEALKRGAFDFVTKPYEQDELRQVVNKAIKYRSLNAAEIVYSPEASEKDGLMGRSDSIRSIYETIHQVAPATTTILVTGETGTGKELIAAAIHRHSNRSSNAYVKINCAAISENLVESELFGYERGAFTGAFVTKPGKFELAHQGTLFLDEVGELPKEMQVKLLRVLQEKEFERVGGLKTIKVDVRLIAATNRNLEQDVQRGNFREDLFYRLNVFPIRVPPLRERKNDIIHLANHFIAKFNRILGKSVRCLDDEVKSCFLDYQWPGNVRELENIIERLVIVARTDTITAESIPENLRKREIECGNEQAERSSTSIRNIVQEQKEDIEKQVIEKALKDCSGNITKAAIQIGLSRKGLQIKMKKYQLRK